MICVFRGELRGFFCELAGSQAMLHQYDAHPDLGIPIEEGWWKKPIESFQKQICYYCHRCGIPLRGKGELAQSTSNESKEQVSLTHFPQYKLKKPDRLVQLVTSLEQVNPDSVQHVTQYLRNV